MSADGARRDALFGRRFQEALVSRRRFECLERIQRGQSIGVHGSLAPLSGSIILSQHYEQRGSRSIAVRNGIAWGNGSG